jgi:putative intracellular protease/amidase
MARYILLYTFFIVCLFMAILVIPFAIASSNAVNDTSDEISFAENISTPAMLLTTIIAGILTVVGGQGPVFTFKQETDLHNKFLEFYNKGKVSAALCNGTSLLLYLKDEDGNPLIQDKNRTGFTDEEEDFSDKYVGKKVMPFRIEDEAKKLGAEFKKTNAFEPFAIKDGNLITCQQQHSGAEVAKLVIDSLGK